MAFSACLKENLTNRNISPSLLSHGLTRRNPMNCRTLLTAALAGSMLCASLTVSAQHSPHGRPPLGGHAPLSRPSFGPLPGGHAPFSRPPFSTRPGGHAPPPSSYGSIRGGRPSYPWAYGPPSGYHHPYPPSPYYGHYYGYDDAWLAPAIIGAFGLGYLLSQPGVHSGIVGYPLWYLPYIDESLIYGE